MAARSDVEFVFIVVLKSRSRHVLLSGTADKPFLLFSWVLCWDLRTSMILWMCWWCSQTGTSVAGETYTVEGLVVVKNWGLSFC